MSVELLAEASSHRDWAASFVLHMEQLEAEIVRLEAKLFETKGALATAQNGAAALSHLHASTDLEQLLASTEVELDETRLQLFSTRLAASSTSARSLSLLR